MVSKASLVAAIFAMAAFICSSTALAQSAGECTGGVCGTPQTSGGGGGGGGCGCGGGSILINNTDDGDTYQYADDYDEDGFEDDYDNCPFVDNKSQADTDGDKIGDACDVCPSTPDLDQLDTDGDGMGDLCDTDMDNDGLDNAMDNCPLVSNFEQLNTDNDQMGDACDSDDDNDSVADTADNCPLVYNPMQESPEQLGNPQCDTDLDLDLVPDSRDNCPAVANADQQDLDGDSLGDMCDTDRDGDKVLDINDNCPDLINADQVDQDRDGKGDLCDNRFCYVVNGDEKNCLDPLDTFKVYSPMEKVRTGEAVRLRLFANRKNTPLRYKWIVTKRPAGSSTTVENPLGTVRVSTPYEYHYLQNNVARFMADEPGEYEVKLQAEQVFEDAINPKYPRSAEYVMTIVADGDSMGGCSMTRGRSASAGGIVLLVLLGLALALRRR